MSLLHEPGELAHTPVAALLLEALNLGVTGVLTISHAGAESRVFLARGVPVGAQTFAAFNPLGQLLLAQRRIDMDALARSLSEMARSGRPQGDVLVEMGAVSRAEVDRALSEQQAGYLALVARLDAGAFAFEPRPVPAWTHGIRIAPLRAIVQALETPQARPLVESAVGPLTAPIALAPGYARLAAAFGWSGADAALVGRLQSVGHVDELFRDPGVAPERARAILAALVLLGLASGPGSPEVVPADAVKEVAVLAGEPIDAEVTPVQGEEAAARTPPAPPPRSREELEAARERRQRLLVRAMQNMGVGPGAARPATSPPAASSTPEQAAGSGRARSDAPAGRSETPPGPEAELRAALAQVLPRAQDPDLFARLGVGRGATREEVKQAYFQLAKRFHPDRFASPHLADLRRTVQDLFSALNHAYEVLGDEKRRAAYLADGDKRTAASAGASLDLLKGDACLRTRDVRRARGFYEAAVRGDPKADHLAALAWALLLDTPSDRERAKQLVAQALRDPRSARAAYVAAMLARQDGNDEAAERHLHAVLALVPAHGDALKELRALEARKVRRERARD